MKKTILFIAFIITAFLGHAQTTKYKYGLYSWTNAIPMQPCLLKDGNNLQEDGKDAGEISSSPGQKFKVLRIIDGMAIIQILDYKDTCKAKKKSERGLEFYKYNFSGTQQDYISLSDNKTNPEKQDTFQRYFKVNLEILEENSRKESYISGTLNCGVINFPFKFRPQKGKQDFSGSFNFGVGIGYTFMHKSWRNYTLSILSGYSISNTVLDSASTTRNQSKLSSTNNFSAFSFSLGIMTEYQHKIQAGIFIGWDRINRINHEQFDWQYQGKSWISIGFGLTVFSKEKEREDKKSNKIINIPGK